MAAWKLKDDADTWESVCERAYSGERQYLTRDGVRYCIAITLAEEPKREQNPFLDFMRSCPEDLSQLDLSRCSDVGANRESAFA